MTNRKYDTPYECGAQDKLLGVDYNPHFIIRENGIAKWKPLQQMSATQVVEYSNGYRDTENLLKEVGSGSQNNTG